MYVIDLEKFLEKNNFTQKQFADLIGVNKNFISSIVKGKDKFPQKRIKMLLDAGIYDTSMIKEVKKNPNLQENDTVTMSREVFNSIQQLVDTINSQQRTIESQQETIKANMGGNAQVAGSAVSADVG